jgi:hypothetical protein
MFIPFVPPEGKVRELSVFIKFWKEWISKNIKKAGSIDGNVWQPEFFDHLLRNEEGSEQKWNFILNNPVRACLVKETKEWSW